MLMQSEVRCGSVHHASTWEAGGRISVQDSLLLHSVFEASLRLLSKIFIYIYLFTIL